MKSNQHKAAIKVKVALGKRSYPILIQENLLDQVGEYLTKKDFSRKIGVVTNPTVGPLYAGRILTSLKNAGFQPEVFLVPDGEKYKSLDSARKLYQQLIKHQFDRSTALVALGGGVIGDLTGFVASTYMRGIPFVQVPTTLESQVDASVGGKVAVDLPEGKNLVGSFYQPQFVFMDPTTLQSLPKRELSAGLAEVIKYGIIWDAEFFQYLETNIQKVFKYDLTVIKMILKRSCEIKAQVVSKDETDIGIRTILNFGHTVGHAVETLTGYDKYRHGEAVAIGMMSVCQLGILMKQFDKPSTNRVKRLLLKTHLPVKVPRLSVKNILESIKLDKKAKNQQIRMVLPIQIGKVSLHTVQDYELLQKSIQMTMEV